MQRTIDIQAMAKKHWPFPDALEHDGEAIAVTSNTRLHRFHAIDATGQQHPDVVHVLTDGAGGAEVIVHPQSTQESRFAEHIAEFVVSDAA
jgi:hypothetical protein